MILNGYAVLDAFFSLLPRGRPRPILWLNVLAGPVFSLLLQSYVPGWPGVLCSDGVLRIGAVRYAPSRQ